MNEKQCKQCLPWLLCKECRLTWKLIKIDKEVNIMYNGLKFIRNEMLTRDQIKQLEDDGFYVEFCDNGRKLLSADIFVSDTEDK